MERERAIKTVKLAHVSLAKKWLDCPDLQGLQGHKSTQIVSWTGKELQC